ncbi:MAG TPA: RNA polymerase sigma-70 factor [Thermomicrobiales bacterium]|nr:RNA polymerase sigma-70 factor [Thermomicrobiales bacterium]
MSEIDPVVAHRSLLFGIAYRMLGSVADAEDALQDTYLRWHRAVGEGTEIRAPKAWLAKTITRICLDQLGSARAKRETYVGPWLPEPLVDGQVPDVAEVVADTDSLSTAFLLLLETLSPKERAVFLLHDVFAYEFSAIAGIVGESEAYCRQIARRARAHVEARRPRFSAPVDQQRRLTERFVRALQEGDMPGLVDLLAEDATVWSDGGGKVTAARKPVSGRDKVATFLVNIVKLAPPGTTFRPTVVNGSPGLVTLVAGRPINVVSFEFVGERVRAIFVVVNPDKLTHLHHDLVFPL